jgi:hypothetical protein
VDGTFQLSRLSNEFLFPTKGHGDGVQEDGDTIQFASGLHPVKLGLGREAVYQGDGKYRKEVLFQVHVSCHIRTDGSIHIYVSKINVFTEEEGKRTMP